MSSTEAEHAPEPGEEPEPEPAEEAGPEPDEESAEREQPGSEPAELAELDRGAIEAILLVSDEPLQAAVLAQVLEQPVARVKAALAELGSEYAEQRRGFELREVAGGWRLYTREEYAVVVEKFVLDGQQTKLTQAALETLAVVAYRQPVSRARVSAIRGVNCDGVMKTLVSRGLVTETGTDNDSGATLFATTAYFLERLGLSSLEELPDLAPYLPDIDEMEELAEGMAGGRGAPAQAADSTPADGPAQPENPATADEHVAADETAQPGEPAEPGEPASAGDDVHPTQHHQEWP